MGNFQAALDAHIALQARFHHSREFLEELREALSAFKCSALREVCVFAAGSVGRLEAGRKSDLDVFLIANRNSRATNQKSITRLQEIEIYSDLIQLNERLQLPAFSGDGRFLKVHELDDLISATGDSARDDNENLFTARLLLLLEGKPLSNEPLHGLALDRVLENYFRDGKGRRDFQPLFLLNDVLRYWRTLCLNYERERTLERPWWKSNLNLKFSRKLTVFSTVLAVVAGHVTTTEEFASFANLVPLERLTVTLDQLGDNSLLSEFPRLLDNYEGFIAAKSYAELETPSDDKLEEFRVKAEEFGGFFERALRSPALDPRRVRYVLI